MLSHIANLSENAITISSTQLAKELEENEVKFMSDYKDKTLEVTGKIENFDSGFDDESVVIELKGGGVILDEVRCTLAKDQAKEVSKYKKGDVVTIKGNCSGATMGSVMLKSCIIVK